jgi:hypothetical protein
MLAVGWGAPEELGGGGAFDFFLPQPDASPTVAMTATMATFLITNRFIILLLARQRRPLLLPRVL